MKSNRTVAFLIVAFLCLCLIPSIGGTVWYINFRNQPPSTITNNSGYYIRGSKVYYLGGFPSTAFEIEGADVKSFVIIDSEYAHDVARVYLNGIPIPDSDPATFEVMDLWFSRDAKHVYLNDEIFSNDPVHFDILGDGLYRDSQHVYWSTEIISDDPASLVILSSQDFYIYIKDSKTVFVNGNPIEGVDIATFEVLAPGYGRDANQIYYFDQAMSTDPATFEVLESPYSRDSQFVFWIKNQIPDANPQTFRVLNADFECSADSERAYHRDQIIPNFAPSTIPADAQVTNCDSAGIYFSP